MHPYIRRLWTLLKVYDIVNRVALWQIVGEAWFSSWLGAYIFRKWHVDIKALFNFNSELSEPIDVFNLSAFLVYSAVGIYLQFPIVVNVFNLSRFNSKTSVFEKLFQEPVYAYKINLVDHSERGTGMWMCIYIYACGSVYMCVFACVCIYIIYLFRWIFEVMEKYETYLYIYI